MSDALLSRSVAPGWFGKLPNVGDFVSRRLSNGFIQEWDRWLEQGLAMARAELGAAWLAGYLVAPIRRFWLAPGVLGKPGWAGLMMPSVDHVGRHFPLTIVQPMETLAAALAARDWFRSVDMLARQVLDVNFTIDDLEQGLSHIAQPDARAADGATRQLANRLLSAFPSGNATVWWCDDTDRANEESDFLCFDAMPPATALVSMMAGEA
jgi:type VI secretion system protein ImpM